MGSVATVKINPTVLLYSGGYAAYLGVLYLGLTTPLGEGYGLIAMSLLQSVFIICMYTPLHEATHRIASKSPAINSFILHSLAPVFGASSELFRRIHLAHHAYTNQGAKDPDHFTSAPTLSERWARSFVLVFSYYRYLLVDDRKHTSILHVSLSLGIFPVFLALGFATGHALVIVFGMIVPAIFAEGLLAFAFTAWPHHPGNDVSRIGNTRIHVGSRPIQWLLFNQNWHLIHHLKPSLRWYEYPAYWREHGDRLLAQGARASGPDIVRWRAKAHREP